MKESLRGSCAGHLASKPGVYHAWTERSTRGDRSVHVNYVKPLTPRSPASLILFATGDAGWLGVSGEIFEHLAQEGYAIVAYDSSEVVAHAKQTGRLVEIPDAAKAVDKIIVQARHALGLPEATPVIATGFSRGANVLVFMAGVKSLQPNLGGRSRSPSHVKPTSSARRLPPPLRPRHSHPPTVRGRREEPRLRRRS